MAIMHKQQHPGEIVKDALIEGANLSVTEAARRLGISRTALSQFLNGHTGISSEMALRLSKLFSTSIEMWLNMQVQYEVWRISQKSNHIQVIPLDDIE